MLPDCSALPPLSPILLAGPTASGKSALAMRLATHYGGCIINADSLQIYHGLEILTAQPSASDRATIPHWLYGECAPADNFSVGQWLPLARASIDKAQSQGLRPIITGGTGLYFQALLHGLAAIPQIPDDVRQALRQEYQIQGEAVMRARLAAHDPTAAATITIGDQLRLLRALEIILATGRTQQAWQSSTSGGVGTANITPILVLPPREQLYAACEKRFDTMVANGAIAEVTALLAQGLRPDASAMKTIGVREIASFLAGTTDWETARRHAHQATRNYAKRQLTWFRNQWQNNRIGFQQTLQIVS